MPVLPDSLTLRDGGVVLRDWREEDAPALEPVCGDDDVCRFTTVPWTYTPSAAAAWVRRVRDHRSSGTAVGLAITREQEDRAGVPDVSLPGVAKTQAPLLLTARRSPIS